MRNYINKKARNVKSDRFIMKKEVISLKKEEKPIESSIEYITPVVEVNVIEPEIVVPTVIETTEIEVEKKTSRKKKNKIENNEEIE